MRRSRLPFSSLLGLVAGVGAVFHGLLLVIAILTPSPDQVTFASGAVKGSALLVLLALVGLVLAGIAVLSRHRQGAGAVAAIAVGGVGTAVATYGVAEGGAAGTMPLLFWPILGLLGAGRLFLQEPLPPGRAPVRPRR